MGIARHHKALTVIELLVGLLITSILLSAVATLAFAMSVGARDADDQIHTQAELRYTTLRISELIRTSRLLCAAPGKDLVLWAADDNHNNLIDVNEVVYLEYDDPNDSLSVREFTVANSPTVLAALGLPETAPVLTTLAQPQTKAALVHAYGPANQMRRITMLHGCRNAVFTADQNPPRTQRLMISFDVAENDSVHRYEIDAALRASAQHLLSSDGSALVSDDD